MDSLTIRLCLPCVLAAVLSLGCPALAQQTPLTPPKPGETRVDGRLLQSPGTASKAAPAPGKAALPPRFRQLMRDIIGELSAYGRSRNPKFVTLTWDAGDLLAYNAWETTWDEADDPDGKLADKRPKRGEILRPYLRAIDGVLAPGVFCGREKYDAPTEGEQQKALFDLADLLQKNGRALLSLDRCRTSKLIDAAYAEGRKRHIPIMVDNDGDTALDGIPKLPSLAAQENPDNVQALKDIRNFAILADSRKLGTKTQALHALAQTNFDLLAIDVFHGPALNEPLTKREVYDLKFKKIGASRKVFALLSLAKADIYKYYWQRDWGVGNPPWLEIADADDPDRFLTRYWEPTWKEIVGKFMAGILELGFDGVVLTDADAYRYWESKFAWD